MATIEGENLVCDVCGRTVFLNQVTLPGSAQLRQFPGYRQQFPAQILRFLGRTTGKGSIQMDISAV